MTLDPITLLLLLIFVLLPIINNLLRGPQRPQGRPPQRPPPPGQRPPSQGQRTARPAQPGTAGGGRGGPDDDFSRRLEEARRRVQEALGEPAEPSTLPESQLWREPQPPETPSAIPPRRDEATRPRPLTPLSERPTAEVAPPMRVQRLAERKPAKLPQEVLLHFEPPGVLRGIIWYQILSEPRVKEKFRRKTLRPR